MKQIRLVFAHSRISEEPGGVTQRLKFAIVVTNPAFRKLVVVHWAGHDGVWHALPAHFAFATGSGCEQWRAATSVHGVHIRDLPGEIRFALQYRVANREYWDNNHGRDYFMGMEGEFLLGEDFPLTQIDYSPQLPADETVLPVTVAVHQSLPVSRVFVRWTVNRWQNYRQTPCLPVRSHRPAGKDHTRHLDEKTLSLWACRLKPRNAGRIDYAIGCETDRGAIWDNNLGIDYTVRHARLKVMTLNLHCWQERDQRKKFEEIARAIRELDVDLVCLQEVGEQWNDGKGDRRTNAAVIIQEHLRLSGHAYHLHTDWSHIGFDRYREGSAILSKQPFLQQQAAYVSPGDDIRSIHSRKVVMAQVHFPGFGRINVFSVHLSWWKDGFRQQFERLRQWAAELDSGRADVTLLCGDFNAKAGSRGYMLIADGGEYEDQFLQAASPAVFARVFRGRLPERERFLDDDTRIDHIFAKRNSLLKPVSATVLFTGHPYMQVSDHPGYLAEFERG